MRTHSAHKCNGHEVVIVEEWNSANGPVLLYTLSEYRNRLCVECDYEISSLFRFMDHPIPKYIGVWEIYLHHLKNISKNQ